MNIVICRSYKIRDANLKKLLTMLTKQQNHNTVVGNWRGRQGLAWRSWAVASHRQQAPMDRASARQPLYLPSASTSALWFSATQTNTQAHTYSDWTV